MIATNHVRVVLDLTDRAVRPALLADVHVRHDGRSAAGTLANLSATARQQQPDQAPSNECDQASVLAVLAHQNPCGMSTRASVNPSERACAACAMFSA